MTRTFPEKIRLAHIHAAAKKEEENAQARAPQSLDLDLGMDQLLPTVPEESPGSLFVPTTMLEIPRPPTSFGRPQLRSGTTSARPRSTPGKRNYFDTESEGEA